ASSSSSTATGSHSCLTTASESSTVRPAATSGTICTRTRSGARTVTWTCAPSVSSVSRRPSRRNERTAPTKRSGASVAFACKACSISTPLLTEKSVKLANTGSAAWRRGWQAFPQPPPPPADSRALQQERTVGRHPHAAVLRADGPLGAESDAVRAVQQHGGRPGAGVLPAAHRIVWAVCLGAGAVVRVAVVGGPVPVANPGAPGAGPAAPGPAPRPKELGRRHLPRPRRVVEDDDNAVLFAAPPVRDRVRRRIRVQNPGLAPAQGVGLPPQPHQPLVELKQRLVPPAPAGGLALGCSGPFGAGRNAFPGGTGSSGPGPVPDHRPPAVRVGFALHADLIAVINHRRANPRHVEHRGQRGLARVAAARRHNPLGVVAAQQVPRPLQRGQRV